jgi:hypothetical protein
VKFIFILISFLGMMPCFADPGITIEVDIFVDKPSGPGGTVMG